jgi:transketolase
MGKGVPFMKTKRNYHGSPLNEKGCKEAVAILGLDDDLERYREQRADIWSYTPLIPDEYPTQIDPGIPFDYRDEDRIDNRTAFGRALKAIADTNIKKGVPVCALDCDLASSVKTDTFAKAYPEYFFQGGIQEHNTATVAGAISLRGVLTFFADFGVFGIDETFNQQRLNDMNMTNLKLILTHVGLDVGQDGKTHQCIDYIGLSRGLFGFKTIVPADPNQVDRVIRYIVCRKGNFMVAMGRNRWPLIKRPDGSHFFGNGYKFEYGRMDIVEEGDEIAIITYGGMLSRAIAIRERLLRKGISVAVVNMPCVNEVDKKVMERYLSMPIIVTYEDHNVYTGIAPVVGDYLLKRGYQGRFDAFGVKNYGASGETDELYRMEGLDVDSMERAILDIF